MRVERRNLRQLLGLLAGACWCGSGSSNLFSSSALDLFSTSSKASWRHARLRSGSHSRCRMSRRHRAHRGGHAHDRQQAGRRRPSALDLRYQATIIRTARECQVNSGVMTMKVGIEGRVITGPAGGPGTVDVPLRLAVVQEGVNPKTIVSKFAQRTSRRGERGRPCSLYAR